MNPRGKTTLNRMMLTAMRCQEEIEGSQRARIKAGLIDRPEREQLMRRNDFAGIVRLIDVIQNDLEAFERIKKLMARRDVMDIDDLATMQPTESEGA